MLTVDITKADYFVDTEQIPLDKAEALKVNCLPIKQYKTIEVGNEEDGLLSVKVYSLWNKLERVGGN